MQDRAIDELEQARLAIQSYYSLSSENQLEPPKTQTELTTLEVNEDATEAVTETLEEKEAEHKATLTSRKRVTPNVKK